MQLSTLVATDRAPLLALLRAIPQFKPDEIDVALELIDASLLDAQGSGYHCLVAREGESVLGYVCFGPTPMTAATWDLYWIAVDPARQGQGLGKRIYGGCADAVRAGGGAQIRIETSSQETYAATGGFYERLGFALDGRLRDFYAAGDDLLIFYRQI